MVGDTITTQVAKPVGKRRRISSMFAYVHEKLGRRGRTNKKNKAANLGPKILKLIFQYLDELDAMMEGVSHSNLFNALLVCKNWSEHARQILYRRVWAFTLKKSETLFDNLKEEKHLCKMVRYMEIAPIWKGTNSKGNTWYSFTRPPRDPDLDWWNTLFDPESFKLYLEVMSRCAALCTELRDVRISADSQIIQEPRRAPRVDHFLDLSHTHIYLKKLLLDDGGMNVTEVSGLFPLTVKLPHLEELTLSNFAFVSPPRDSKSRLFRGLRWFEQIELADPFPRLKSLRLIHCTAENDAFAPLMRTLPGSMNSMTIVQAPHRYSISPEGDPTTWHTRFSEESELFTSITKRLTHLTLGTRFFRPTNHLSQVNLVYLRITAEQFQKGSFQYFPKTLEYLGLWVTSDLDLHWISGATIARVRKVDVFEELETMLRGGTVYLPQFRFLSLRFLPMAKEKPKLWVKSWQIKRLCRSRSRKVEMSVCTTGRRDPWGEPLPPEGRRWTRSIDLPNPITGSPTPTRAGRVIRRLVSQNQLSV